MKKLLLYLTMTVLLLFLVNAETYWDCLTKGYADTLYCAIGSCGGSGGGGKYGDGIYLYNDTSTMYFNETKLNSTIDARSSGGDNLGDHIATQNLNMTNKNITFSDGGYMYDNGTHLILGHT